MMTDIEGSFMPLKVLLIDDHDTVIRLGLRALFERAGFEVIGSTSDGLKAAKLAALHQPDLALIDEPLPFDDPIDTVRGIRRASPRTRIILLTMYTQGRTVLSGLRAGVCGVIVKSEGFKESLRTVSELCADVYASTDPCYPFYKGHIGSGEQREHQLHGRQRQVLQLVAEGRTTKEIATILGISVRTAEFHRHEIKEKLDIHDTAGLVRFAIRGGLILP